MTVNKTYQVSKKDLKEFEALTKRHKSTTVIQFEHEEKKFKRNLQFLEPKLYCSAFVSSAYILMPRRLRSANVTVSNFGIATSHKTVLSIDIPNKDIRRMILIVGSGGNKQVNHYLPLTFSSPVLAQITCFNPLHDPLDTSLIDQIKALDVHTNSIKFNETANWREEPNLSTWKFTKPRIGSSYVSTSSATKSHSYLEQEVHVPVKLFSKSFFINGDMIVNYAVPVFIEDSSRPAKAHIEIDLKDKNNNSLLPNPVKSTIVTIKNTLTELSGFVKLLPSTRKITLRLVVNKSTTSIDSSGNARFHYPFMNITHRQICFLPF